MRYIIYEVGLKILQISEDRAAQLMGEGKLPVVVQLRPDMKAWPRDEFVASATRLGYDTRKWALCPD